MTPLIISLHVLLALVLGLALGFLHASASHHAAARALATQRAGLLLLGFPLRVAVPALALFGLALLSLWALAAGLLAFWVGSRLALRRAVES